MMQPRPPAPSKPHAPPSAADPFPRPPPPPPAQHGHPWSYSTPQFQYQVQHSPFPQPPQWLPPQSHSSDHAQYLHPPPPPPPPHYPGHQLPPYPVHRPYPQSHPLPPRPPHASQSYSQDLANGSLSDHLGWDYQNQSNSNEQDWAEKARAWAVAKATADNQYSVPVGRPEEQNYFHDQYPRSINPQFQSVHVPIEHASSYQQYPVGMGLSNRTGPGQLQESQHITAGQSSYTVDMHAPDASTDGNLMGNSCEPTHPQENSSLSSSPFHQEVPSSYSSVSGNEGGGDRYEHYNSSSSIHVAAMPHHHAQSLPPAVSRSGWAEDHHHLLSSKPNEFVIGISDQPLNFSHHFSRNLDQNMPPSSTHPSGCVSRSTNYAWNPSFSSGIVHPPIPPMISPGAQVTDELFDEIATKLLNEDDLSGEVVQNPDMSNHFLLPSTPTISTSMASAKVLIPSKTMKNNSEDGSEKSTSGSAGDVLGLGSYASDEEDEIQISGRLNSKESSTNQHSSANKILEDTRSRKEIEEHGLENTGIETPMISKDNVNAANVGVKDDKAVRELSSSDTLRSSKKASRKNEMHHGSVICMPNKFVPDEAVERPDGNLDAKSLSDNSRVQKSGNISDKNDIHGNKSNLVENDYKKPEHAKEMVDRKGDENHRRHARMEMEYCTCSKVKGKEKGRSGERAQDPEARKLPSPSEGKEGKYDTRGDKRKSSKEISDEKRHDKTRDEKRERSRYKIVCVANKHKPHRLSTVGSRDSYKDNLVAGRSNGSSDEPADASKRKSRHSKRHTSPSSTRSRKRQVSRSSHSKNSKSRHTHYSSLEPGEDQHQGQDQDRQYAGDDNRIECIEAIGTWTSQLAQGASNGMNLKPCRNSQFILVIES